MNIILKSPFFISVLGGILVWLVVFFITPVYVVKTIDTETIIFILLGYLFLIVGYLSVPKINISKTKNINTKHITYIILFILLCYIVRYVDIFYYRELRFSNTIYQNRYLAEKEKYHFIFIVFNIFKTLYFVPLLLLLFNNKRNKQLVIIATLLFLLPLVEAILRGSRSPFLQSFVYFIILLLVTKNIRFSKKSTLIFLTALGVLFVISTEILIKREGPKNKNPYKYLVTNAIYNDFLRPKKYVVEFMSNPNTSNFKKKIGLSSIQIGQYYTHGVFEFDNIVKYYKQNAFKKQFGKYTFHLFPKFTNYLKITNIDMDQINNASPRGYVFISFFGGMYLDFGWLVMPIIFLLGYIQGIVFKKTAAKNYYYAPLFIFFILTNFFLLTTNFFRGTGTYTIISCIIFALISIGFKENKIYEKSIST